MARMASNVPSASHRKDAARATFHNPDAIIRWQNQSNFPGLLKLVHQDFQ